MSPETIAAVASLVTAFAVFVTAWRSGIRADARAEALAVKTDRSAVELKRELGDRADSLERKTDETAVAHQEGIARVEVLVNGRMKEALDRIAELEEKLGLAEGAPVPVSQILTAPHGPKDETAEVADGVVEVETGQPKPKRKRAARKRPK